MVIDIKAMHLPEIFDFRLFPIVESQKFSKSKIFEVQNWTKIKQGFRTSKNFAKLTKNFPETLVRNPCPKIYRNFRHMSKMFKIYRYFRDAKSVVRPSYTENGQKHKKLFFLAPERARAILSVFLDHLALYTHRFFISVLNVMHATSVIYATSVMIGSNRSDRIDSIRLQKWICGQILSCLDLN